MSTKPVTGMVLAKKRAKYCRWWRLSRTGSWATLHLILAKAIRWKRCYSLSKRNVRQTIG